MAAAAVRGEMDETLSAMLSSDHGHYSSLASVMTSSNSPSSSAAGVGDLFTSQYSSLQESRRPNGDQWPFSRNEKWTLDTKYEAAQVSNPLQRYHSAPSAFLQSLADFTEEAAAEGDGCFRTETLAPINERAVDSIFESLDACAEYEQFLDFAKPSSTELGPLTRQDLGHGGFSTPESLGARRSKILRQSSSPADFLAAVRDNLEEPTSPVFKMPNFVEESNVAVGWLGTSSLKVRSGESKLGLIRHSSLPATSRPFSPSVELDDLAEFSTSVPCKSTTRASRGFATHPRSIAERVRRTRISERMKKLQDLVPNMDRQTSTADMLDEAVEYVKQLQLQVQELSETVVQLKESLVHRN